MRAALLGLAAPLIAFATGSPTQAFPLGVRATASPEDYSTVANVPNFGGVFVYVKGPGTALNVGDPVQMDKNWNISALPNTANTGAPLAFCSNSFSATNLYGWVQISGIGPVKVSLASAVGPLFITGAGTLGQTIAAGKQILGCAAILASTAAFTKAGCKLVIGQSTIRVPDTDGLYAGLTLSGTGVGAGAKITDIDVGGKIVTVDVVNTATGNPITVTATMTGYVVATMSEPFVQGQIT